MPDKCIVIAAPHTSNWDFIFGRCAAYIVGIDPKYLIEESQKAEKKINQFIEEVKNEYNLKNHQICLSGFSQGCMISINLGLTSQENFNCIVGFSGKIISKKDIIQRKKIEYKNVIDAW